MPVAPREPMGQGAIRDLAAAVTALLLALALGTTACPAAGLASEAGEGHARRTLWAFPPAVEVVDYPGGYHSVEFGLTPAFWASDGGLSLEPRLGALWYPEGGASGLAVYAGATLDRAEIGLWYVWRDAGGERASRLWSFRVGLGSVRDIGPDGTSSGQAAFGAAIGFTF